MNRFNAWFGASRRRTSFLALLATILAVLPSARAHASYINLSSFTLVSTVRTTGEYDNRDLSTWNGQPLSATNQPTPQDDELAATWNFYVDPNSPNTLYIAVSNVADPNFGFIFGTPFYITALTGFQFSLPVPTDAYAVFSNQYAVQGQELVGPSGNSVFIDTTPGWALLSTTGAPSDAVYNIGTTGGINDSDAFTHFTDVTGDTRILNGGVFQLTFDPTIDLLGLSFADLTASASNGEGAYTEAGTVTYFHTVPEPATWAILLAYLLGMGAMMHSAHRRASTTA